MATKRKLSDMERFEIVERVKRGESYGSIASELQLPPTTVRTAARAAGVSSSARSSQTPGTKRWNAGLACGNAMWSEPRRRTR